jgi:hypothetical protein
MSEDMIVEVLIPAEAPEDVRDKMFDAIADAAYAAQPEDRDEWDITVSAGPANGLVHIGHNGGHRARWIVLGVLLNELGELSLKRGSQTEALANKIVDALVEGEKL